MSGAIPPLPYMPSCRAQQLYLLCVCVCADARTRACYETTQPYLNFNTFISCFGSRDLSCKVYVIFTKQPGKSVTVYSGNRVRAVAKFSRNEEGTDYSWEICGTLFRL
jgi:hypothetical protein